MLAILFKIKTDTIAVTLSNEPFMMKRRLGL
jgi:hypothetical protein